MTARDKAGEVLAKRLAPEALEAALEALDEAGLLADPEESFGLTLARLGMQSHKLQQAEEALARVEALADEWQGEARAHREAAIRDADIERDWIASEIEHRLTYLRAALRGDQ